MDRISRRRTMAMLGAMLGAMLARVLTLVTVARVSCAATPTAPADDIRFFRIGTGATGGTEFPIGGFLASAISSPPGAPPCVKGGPCGVPGLIAVAVTTEGSIDNIEQLRLGMIDSALVHADIVSWSRRGDGPYAGKLPLPWLRSIANLTRDAIHLVVRADSTIAGIADLKGKAVSLGEEGSGAVVEARRLLAGSGLAETELRAAYLKPGSAADRLVNGTLDGFFVVGEPPVAAVADIADRIPIRLIPIAATMIESTRDRRSFLSNVVIPEGTYAGVAATSTLAVGTQWIVRDDIDADLVYGITRALWNPANLALLSAHRPQGATIQVVNAAAQLAAPLHPGAARYYRETGMPIDTAESAF